LNTKSKLHDIFISNVTNKKIFIDIIGKIEKNINVKDIQKSRYKYKEATIRNENRMYVNNREYLV